MTKLVQMLLENNGRILSGTKPSTQLPAQHNIDQQVIRQVTLTAQRIQFQECGGFTRDFRKSRKAANQAVALCATQALSKIPLLEFGCYSAVKKAIQAWKPGEDAESKTKCQRLRQMLLEFLPLTQKKQRLQTVCQNYQSHLIQEIESQLQNDHPEAYARHCISRYHQQRMIKAGDMDYFVSHEAEKLNLPKDSPLQQAIQKYEAVAALQKNLQSQKTISEQIQNFRQMLTQKQKILGQRRDANSVRFLKAVATIFTLGLAALCGIWNVKGQGAVKKMDNILDKPHLNPI